MSKVLDEVKSIRERSWADRPSPAIPLLLLALVVTGALVVALSVPASRTVSTSDGGKFALVETLPSHGSIRLVYWIVASVIAYLLAIWIARRQGYRSGVWVDRRPLVVAGLGSLLVVVIVVLAWFSPTDLTLHGNVPLLAIAAGIVVWAVRERRPGLWILAAVIVPLTLLANLYYLANLYFRLGVPDFEGVGEVASLGTVAVVLFAASAVFGLLHRRDARALAKGGER